MLDLVLVNGLPGSGKTTLATELAKALEAPLICKDAIKEAVADIVPGVPYPTLGVAAAEMMWTLAAGMAGDVVLESWWFKPRDLAFVEAGLRRCSPASVVEVWCDVPRRLFDPPLRCLRRGAPARSANRPPTFASSHTIWTIGPVPQQA